MDLVNLLFAVQGAAAAGPLPAAPAAAAEGETGDAGASFAAILAERRLTSESDVVVPGRVADDDDDDRESAPPLPVLPPSFVAPDALKPTRVSHEVPFTAGQAAVVSVPQPGPLVATDEGTPEDPEAVRPASTRPETPGPPTSPETPGPPTSPETPGPAKTGADAAPTPAAVPVPPVNAPAVMPEGPASRPPADVNVRQAAGARVQAQPAMRTVTAAPEVPEKSARPSNRQPADAGQPATDMAPASRAAAVDAPRSERRPDAHGQSRARADLALAAAFAAGGAAEAVPRAEPPTGAMPAPAPPPRLQEQPHPLVMRPPAAAMPEERTPAPHVDVRAAVEVFARIERAAFGEQHGTGQGRDGERGTPERIPRAAMPTPEAPMPFEAFTAPASPEAPAAEAPAEAPVEGQRETTAGLGLQLVKAIRLQWREGNGEARLRLNPEHLGEVVVQLHVGRGGVTAAMSAESSEVRAWMAAHEDDLRAGLEEQGLQLASLRVSDEPPEERRRQDRPHEAPKRRPRKDDDGQAVFELSA